MPELGPTHPFSYRHEVVARLFRAIRAGDSAAIIGPASMGKSRLLRYILRSDAQQHFLGERAADALIALVDCNRLAEITDWGLYELLVTALIEVSGRHTRTHRLREPLNELRSEIIVTGNTLLARRHAELAFHMLCEETGFRLCLILDEFDEAYRRLSAQALANLRALRDAYKYQLSYVLVMREHPERIRPPAECEAFFELFARSVIGLGPYSRDDAGRVLDQLEARKEQVIPEPERRELLKVSGGHPGLIVALFDALRFDDLPAEEEWLEWALDHPTISAESAKLWDSLAEDEQVVLSRVAHGIPDTSPASALLEMKGLVRAVDGRQELFSPLFAEYVRSQAVPASQSLTVDEDARVVTIGDQRIDDLTALEFDLLLILHQNRGKVCSREQILAALYPDDMLNPDDSPQDNRVDTLVRRVRQKIEPVREHPRYLRTVRGKGYRLEDLPDPSL